MAESGNKPRLTLGEVSLLTENVPRLAAFYRLLFGISEADAEDTSNETHQFIGGAIPLTVYNDGTAKNNKNENMTVAFTAEDTEVEYARLKALGVEITEPPALRPWGAVNMKLRDPDGNAIYIRSFGKKP